MRTKRTTDASRATPIPTVIAAIALAAGLARAGAAELTLSVPLPGVVEAVNTFTVTGATPEATVRLVIGSVAGTTLVPGCGGATVDVSTAGVFLVLTATADAAGEATFSPFVPAAASDRTLLFQAVDTVACTVSPRVDFAWVPHPFDDTIRMNHVQVRGSHNSYHVAPLIPFHPSHVYTHQPLDVQLEEQGVRAFELDVHRTLTGWQVYHITVIDALSTCRQFEDCLSTVQGWSAAHPDHLPIWIWIEAKDDAGGLPIEDLGPVDDVIRSVIPPAQLLTPDDVQGSYASLRERIETEGWPTLGEVRGRIMFILLDTGEKARDYTFDYQSLGGRAMFANAEADQLDQPWAVVRKINDPTNTVEIEAALAAEMLVASNVCNADETDEQCFADLAAAEANGVHMLKDDFPAPVPERDYWLELSRGEPAQCHPFAATEVCSPGVLESLE